jgi:hypothetical protein
MGSWTGIALARTAPGGDGMHSRLSTYLHPLAGRPLAWHSVSALLRLRPAPDKLILVGGPELNAGIFPEAADRLEMLGPGAIDPEDLPDLGRGPVLVVDAAAPALGPALRNLLEETEGTVLPGPGGSIAAALLSVEAAAEMLQQGRTLDELADSGGGLRRLDALPQALVVRDRITLTRASRLIRDRIVETLMESGVTFLLPESVLIDIDVQIGRDSVVYPGTVIEGQTIIGDETVVGPGCRIIDSWIGSGVELKGWNFISRSSIRNRAILEPYVRRGFD